MSIALDSYAAKLDIKARENEKSFREIIRLASKLFASVEAKRIIAIAKEALGE